MKCWAAYRNEYSKLFWSPVGVAEQREAEISWIFPSRVLAGFHSWISISKRIRYKYHIIPALDSSKLSRIIFRHNFPIEKAFITRLHNILRFINSTFSCNGTSMAQSFKQLEILSSIIPMCRLVYQKSSTIFGNKERIRQSQIVSPVSVSLCLPQHASFIIELVP